MKKICFLLFIATTLSGNFSVQAYTSCKGGYEVKHQRTSRPFCISYDGMNWWSAVNWCKGNGGQLATESALCPGGGSCLEGCNTHWVANPKKRLCTQVLSKRTGNLNGKNQAICE